MFVLFKSVFYTSESMFLVIEIQIVSTDIKNVFFKDPCVVPDLGAIQ